MTLTRVTTLLAVIASVQLTLAQEPASDAGAGIPLFSPVTWERLVNAADEPHNWLMYSGTFDSQRFSRLDQIDTSNVAGLKLVWAHHIPQLDRNETTPLVVDGVMFITESPSNVTAVDAASGRPYWRYEHELPDDLRICCGRNNRGVAILDETLYMSTLDAHIVGVDARSGSLLWNTEVADHQEGYSKTAAPLIVKDKVVTGIAGGEFGIRGFLDAYDAKTGTREWRTHTIPGPDHPDNRSWAGDSWRTGGSPTWITGSYDPELDLVYWGTGNPGPDYNGDVRGGDNLYADSVIALDGDSGEMSWYFQFTPHDVHDWDAIQIPVLADIEVDGTSRKAMLWANRNAFYYTLDRETGEFLVGKPFARQTWAEGLDENGRPIRRPDTFPSTEGTLVAPTAGGATNWWSPAYSPIIPSSPGAGVASCVSSIGWSRVYRWSGYFVNFVCWCRYGLVVACPAWALSQPRVGSRVDGCSGTHQPKYGSLAEADTATGGRNDDCRGFLHTVQASHLACRGYWSCVYRYQECSNQRWSRNPPQPRPRLYEGGLWDSRVVGAIAGTLLVF